MEKALSYSMITHLFPLPEPWWRWAVGDEGLSIRSSLRESAKFTGNKAHESMPPQDCNPQEFLALILAVIRIASQMILQLTAPVDSASGEQIWLWLSGCTWLSRFHGCGLPCNISSPGSSKKIVDFHFIQFLLTVRIGVTTPRLFTGWGETRSSFTPVLHNSLSQPECLSPCKLLGCQLYPS